MTQKGTSNREQQAAELAHELLKLGWRLRQEANKAFEMLGLTPVQVVMLVYIERGYTQPKQLTTVLDIHFPATSTLLGQLGEQGLIKRSGDTLDSRYVNLELTPKGHVILHTVKEAWRQNSTFDPAALTDAELMILLKLCQALTFSTSLN